jgi:hypothetical protein
MEIQYKTLWCKGSDAEDLAELAARRLGISILRDLESVLAVKQMNGYVNKKNNRYDLVTIPNPKDFVSKDTLNFNQVYVRGNKGDVMVYLKLEQPDNEDEGNPQYRGIVKLCSNQKTLDMLIPILDKYAPKKQ